MRTFSSHLYPSILLFAAAIVVPSFVLAEDRLNPNVGGGLLTPRIFDGSVLIAQPVKSRVEMRARDMRSDLTADPRARAADIPLAQTAVLSAFRLGFSNGDHHVKEVTVLRAGDWARGVLADDNGDDNYVFTASWWNIQGVVSGEVRGAADYGLRQRGVDIPAGPPNTTLALTGFSLKVPKDNEIYGLSVRLDGTTNKAKFAPETTDAVYVAVEYIIQYAWVPNGALNGNVTVTGGGLGESARQSLGTSGPLPNNDRYILRGFEFGYNDSNRSAQNLLELAIALPPTRDYAPNRKVVEWRDNDLNEHISWRVDYSLLK